MTALKLYEICLWLKELIKKDPKCFLPIKGSMLYELSRCEPFGPTRRAFELELLSLKHDDGELDILKLKLKALGWGGDLDGLTTL